MTPYQEFLRYADRRRRQMHRLRLAGWSDARIADKFGLSRQRVHKILGPRK